MRWISKLGDPVTSLEFHGVVLVRVQEADLDFAAVSGVNGAWGVDYGEAVLGGQSGPWVDQPNGSEGQAHGYAGRYKLSFPWGQAEVNCCAMVGAGVARLSVGEYYEGVVEPLEFDGQGGRAYGCVKGHRSLSVGVALGAHRDLLFFGFAPPWKQNRSYASRWIYCSVLGRRTWESLWTAWLLGL